MVIEAVATAQVGWAMPTTGAAGAVGCAFTVTALLTTETQDPFLAITV